MKRNDSVVAVSVILNIQEESGKETGSSGKKTKDDSPMGDQVDFDGGTVPQKNFMTPLFRIFKAERANTVQRVRNSINFQFNIPITPHLRPL